MIKVLHLTYDMRIGGTEMVIKNIIEGNVDTNIEMSIYCIESPLGPWGKDLKRSGVSVTNTERKPGFDIRLIKVIREHIQKNKIDILHCHQYTPWVYGAFAAMFTNVEVIFTEHGRFYPEVENWKRRLVNPLLVYLTSQVTAISNATKEALCKYEHISNDKIKVIYNGIEPLKSNNKRIAELRRDLAIRENTIIFGTIARLDPIKNQVLMLRAYSKLFKEFKNTRLLIVGDGEEMTSLKNLATSLSIENNVIFTGYISNPIYHIGLIDIFLLSSLSEGTSMTLLEAMSLSKPCIVTDAGGNSEIIHNDNNGFVVENNNENDFYVAMKTLLANPELRERMGKSGKRVFDQMFHQKLMSNEYSELYRS